MKSSSPTYLGTIPPSYLISDRIVEMFKQRKVWLIARQIEIETKQPVSNAELVKRTLATYPNDFSGENNVLRVADSLCPMWAFRQYREVLETNGKGDVYFQYWTFYVKVLDEFGFWKALGIVSAITAIGTAVGTFTVTATIELFSPNFHF